MSKNVIKVLNCGRLSYAKALKLQNALAKRHYESENLHEIHDTLLIVEHQPVYTIGIRTKDYSESDIKLLKATGADFHKTNRGGLITFHGPGQLVAYPIINLKRYHCTIKSYVHSLERLVIRLCRNCYNLNANCSPYTGVWVNDKKICAIGIHGSRYVTTHGLALNCDNDLTWFNHIIPCGIKDKGVTSISKETGDAIGVDLVVPQLLDSFCHTFQCNVTDFPQNDKEILLHSLD